MLFRSAEDAGILQGDVLVRFADKEITSFKQFRQLLYSKKVNEVVEIVLSRDGELITVQVKLQ